ncbi:protein LKAAEAR1-like isoform X2 [Anneissia japonica]|uniref:protein LKAAEAR1-like isoform X2 n=1 Tax=Anneissia japonica TaxID=1529436 RepID=UPI0014258F47|nr:protein LKAAEAR1-like isoform X2 [Anneissia japonica]XP_033099442.1 protein LKAAEAR1-like isoform X2 [Anneissia japonica]XP_033099443.1 protein LKAAEAR1-like isoform X2 [Anneissia japonica]XP_033099444.1 protein LKAAEAR1-like isoform X2 [Anneissia japonica]
MGDDKVRSANSNQKFKPQNRKKLTQREVNALPPVQRGRYLAYEEPSKSTLEAIANSKKRIQEKSKKLADIEKIQNVVDLEKEKHSQLIGQLKAAEARNRLRVIRLRYQTNRAQEVKHLISCQPTAIKAVRLQVLVPPYPDAESPGDNIDKLERKRIEELLEDEACLTTDRELS